MKRRKHSPAKKSSAKHSLSLPDLDQARSAVLNSLPSRESQRGYRHAIGEFITWYCSEPRLPFNKAVVTRYRIQLEFRQLAPGTINGRLAAVRQLAYARARGPPSGSGRIRVVLVSIDSTPQRPKWLRAPAPVGENYRDLKGLVERLRLHTVCESAACPNVGECWNRRTATFMILGNVCTRRCGFCAVQKGAPLTVDYDEPARVAEAVELLGLKYAVITSVNRDDRKDGGAELFALTIRAIRERLPGCKVEVLIPDFQGSHAAMDLVMEAGPDVLNHNTETVPRLYRQVRLGARYERSLDILEYAKKVRPEIPTKSGLMLGLGETTAEVHKVMRDLVAHQVDILTLGQYLRPSLKHLPILRYIPQSEFDDYKSAGAAMGFAHVEAGPLVRSSYHADEGGTAISARACK